jgi:eukaryotic-like serine/threonine-protein kinase
MTASPSFMPGTLIGQRYHIVRAVAQGGMGAVYEAWDMRLSNRRCAIKVLRDASMTPDDQVEAATWFEREAQILSHCWDSWIKTMISSVRLVMR